MKAQTINLIKSEPGAMILEVWKTKNRRTFEILRMVDRPEASYRGYPGFALFAIDPNVEQANNMFAQAKEKYLTERREAGKKEVKAIKKGSKTHESI